MRLAATTLFATLALAGCGSDGDEAAATQPVTVTETVTTTVEAPPATTAAPEADCSTAGLRLTLPEQDLPDAVAETRRRVFDAAVACDYDELERIASESEGFTFSFGAEGSPGEHWRGLEEEGTAQPLPMRALATILTMPFTRNEAGSYAWPAAYDESPTDEAWQALVDAGLYTQEQVDLMRGQGTGYLGYRTAITPDGQWQFFVAGD